MKHKRFQFLFAGVFIFAGALYAQTPESAQTSAWAQITDLTVTKNDIRIEADPVSGYHVYIRQKPGMRSVLLTETTKDPEGEEDNYAYRAAEWNAVNGDELRLLDGEFLVSPWSQYSLIDSTPEPDAVFGSAFHIFMPEEMLYGYPWTRHGSVKIEKGTFINVRTFERPYADYDGNFEENPFMLDIVVEEPRQKPAREEPVPEPPAQEPVPEEPEEEAPAEEPPPAPQEDEPEAEEQPERIVPPVPPRERRRIPPAEPGEPEPEPEPPQVVEEIVPEPEPEPEPEIVEEPETEEPEVVEELIPEEEPEPEVADGPQLEEEAEVVEEPVPEEEPEPEAENEPQIEEPEPEVVEESEPEVAEAPAPEEPEPEGEEPKSAPAKLVLTDSYNPAAAQSFEELGKGKIIYSQGPETIVDDIIDSLLAIKPRDFVDVVFAIDTTGSMKDDIEMLKEELVPRLTAELMQFGKLRLGLLLYRDWGDTYNYKDLPVRYYAFTEDAPTFFRRIDAIKIIGSEGGDEPEAVYEALYAAIKFYDWQAPAARRIILIGDAPPHTKNNRNSKINFSAELIEQLAAKNDITISTIVLPSDKMKR